MFSVVNHNTRENCKLHVQSKFDHIVLMICNDNEDFATGILYRLI